MSPKTYLLLAGLAAIFPGRLCAAEANLPGTRPLETSDDLSVQMVAGIHRYLDRETAQVAAARHERWKAYGPADLTGARELLRRRLGLNDPRVKGAFDVIQPLGEGAETGTGPKAVRWPVFEGVWGEGLLFQPPRKARAIVIALPDAGQTPEEYANQIAAPLVAQGCTVLVPVLVNRQDTWSGNDVVGRYTNQPHREWIYRQAFEVGRTLIGYEVQKILAALDAFGATDARRVGLIGTGEGALLALHAAALDSRCKTTLVSGYFGPREGLWNEPIYRNVPSLLRDFGDAELAALIAPWLLIVDPTPAAEINGPPAPRENRKGAAPGIAGSPALAAVEAEVNRARKLQPPLSPNEIPHSHIVLAADREKALDTFARSLGLEWPPSIQSAPPIPAAPTPDERQHRAVRELEAHTQRILGASEWQRNETDFWKKLAPSPDWTALQKAARQKFRQEVIGEISTAYLPPNPRSRVALSSEKWIAHDVVLDVQPDVFAWGLLLVPKSLKPGERRPVVVCQHGLEGLPMDTVTDDQKNKAWAYYHGFAARLADEGFIVFAPHNPYRGEDAFRTLQRKANPLGLSLFSFIIAQHEVITHWLATLPFVDPQRIGFYGLSYGGKTAMRVPAAIENYALSICSGDFNEWVRKNASTEYPSSYLFSKEYEIFEWDLAHTFNYAEMALLIAPRPFMVERGHKDGVATSEWVGYEFAKVLRGYTRLGFPERAQIEWFDGPHTINGVGTFQFLHQHLNWPTPASAPR